MKNTQDDTATEGCAPATGYARLLPILPLNLKTGQPIRYRKGGRIRRGHIVCLQIRRTEREPYRYTVDDYKGRRVSVDVVSIVATDRHTAPDEIPTGRGGHG